MKTQRMTWIGSIALAALAGSLTIGCEGVLGDSSEQNAGSGTDGSTGANGSNATGNGDNDPVGGATAGLSAGAQQTLLARLTNVEFVRSLEILLDLPAGSPGLTSAISALAPEPSVHGLRNDAGTQALTQVAIAGFERLAATATQELLDGASNNEQLAERLGCSYDGDDQVTDCLSTYGAGLLQRASRRDNNSEYAATIQSILDGVMALQDAEGVDSSNFESRVLQLQSIISYVALSPDFLLLIEGENADGDATDPIALTNHEIASRLSFFLAGEPPDDALLAAASAGELTSPEARIEQVDRLLARPEGTSTFVKAIVGWLGVNQDAADAEDIEALSSYLNAWVEDQSSFTEFYGGAIDVATADGSTASQSVGVLGAPAFLEAHTFPPTPGFITRGVFVVEQLLCSALPDDLPAEAFGSDEMNEREVFDNHSKQACATCHVAFDNYGAAFQNYDTETNAFDPANNLLGDEFTLHTIGDIGGDVSNLEDLASQMSESERAPACMAQLFYRHAMRRSLRGGDGDAVTRLVQDWVQSEMSLRSLLVGIVGADEFATLYP